MSYGVGHKHGSDLALLWLWYRPEAVAPIRPLAWEPLYAVGVALKKKKRKKTVKAGTPAHIQPTDCWRLTHGGVFYGRVSRMDQPYLLELSSCRIGWQRRLGRALLRRMGSGQIGGWF